MNKKVVITTNIKFQQEGTGTSTRLLGFVTKVNGSWRGCREDVELKKIVFPAPYLQSSIVPGALYRCGLANMDNNKGFIAVSAKIVQFEATISTIVNPDENKVVVKYGNRVVVYNPASSDERENNIQTIANKLRSRIDLANSCQVAEDFIDAAFMLRQQYNMSGNVR